MSVEDLIIDKNIVLNIQGRLDVYLEYDEERNIPDSEVDRMENLAEDVLKTLEKTYKDYEEKFPKKEFFKYVLELSAQWGGRDLRGWVYDSAKFRIELM